MKRFIASAAIIASMSSVAFAADSTDSKLTSRIDAAHAVLHELMATPDKGIPLNIAAKAECVLVVPAFKKGAFVVGGQYGQGLATCRTGDGWSAPVFIQLTGASFGFQIGGQSTDLVLVGINKKSADDLLKDKVKLGGDISAAAGPVGRSSEASTTELANAEFLTYSRAKGTVCRNQPEWRRGSPEYEGHGVVLRFRRSVPEDSEWRDSDAGERKALHRDGERDVQAWAGSAVSHLVVGPGVVQRIFWMAPVLLGHALAEQPGFGAHSDREGSPNRDR